MSVATRWELPQFDVGEKLPTGLRTARHLDDLERAGWQEGYESGHAEGIAAGLRESREQAQRLRALVEHLGRPLETIDEDTRRALVALTVQVARRLAQHALELDANKVAGVVREALSALAGPARDIQVHLHPDDAKLLAATLEPPPDAREFRIVASRELQRGDCRIVTEAGQVDGRLDTREASVAQALLGDEK
jgi:flagellar assembly protein FliH